MVYLKPEMLASVPEGIEVVNIACNFQADDYRVEIKETIRELETKVDISAADVVAGGYGLGLAEGRY